MNVNRYLKSNAIHSNCYARTKNIIPMPKKKKKKKEKRKRKKHWNRELRALTLIVL